MGGSEKTTETSKKTTITWWQTPLGRTLTLWIELATKELLGCPWELVVFWMLALYTLKLLVEAACWFWRLCPTQESNQELERKFPEVWRTTFHDNHSVRFKLDFKLAWHKVWATDVQGCYCFHVFFHVFSTCVIRRWHFTTLVQARRKPKRTIFWEENFGVHIKTWSIICANDKSLFTKKLVQGDPCTSALPKRRWMERKSGKCTGSSTYSFTVRSSGFQKTSSASLSSLLYPPDQWIEIPSGLHAIAVVMGHVRYGQGTSPSCTHQGRHGKHRMGTTHGTLAHRIAEGMQTGKSSSIGPISKGP